MRRLFALATALLLVGSVHAQGVKPVEALGVYDSTGRRLGPVVDFDDSTISGNNSLFGPQDVPRVSMRIDDDPVTLNVYREKLGGNAFGPFFESDDCGGTPFISPRDGSYTLFRSPLRPVAVAGPGDLVFIALPDAARQERAVRSVLLQGSSCVVFPSPRTIDVIEARPPIDLATVFVPPFEIRAEPGVEEELAELRARLDLIESLPPIKKYLDLIGGLTTAPIDDD